MLPDLSKVIPYPLDTGTDQVSYTFTTDKGIKYLIAFDDKTSDYSSADIGDSIIYEYQFYPTSDIDDEEHDARVMATILNSISLAMSQSHQVLLYICENSDKKGLLRARLFDYIFRRYGGERFIKIDGGIKASKHSDEINYVSVIVSNENRDKDLINYTFQQVLFHVELDKLPRF
jgi:hypothetical protein